MMTTTTGRAARAALPARFELARQLARELHAAQVLGAVAGDVWQAAEHAAVGRDAWTRMLALACDLVTLAGHVAPDDETAENIGAVADGLAAACFGGPITPTAAAVAARAA